MNVHFDLQQHCNEYFYLDAVFDIKKSFTCYYDISGKTNGSVVVDGCCVFQVKQYKSRWDQ